MIFQLNAATRLLAAVTTKGVEKAIKKKFGYDVRLHKGYGYFYFDDPDEAPMRLIKWRSTSVYVNSLYQLTLDQWLSEFQALMEDNEDRE